MTLDEAGLGSSNLIMWLGSCWLSEVMGRMVIIIIVDILIY